MPEQKQIQRSKNYFRDTGTIHLFAASGLQVGLFTGLAWSCLRYIRLPRQSVALAIVPGIIAYCALTGFYPATVRATVMAMFMAVGISLERPVATVNSLCGSGLLILMHDTQELFQTGFQLSFVAVFAILTTVTTLRASALSSVSGRSVFAGAIVVALATNLAQGNASSLRDLQSLDRLLGCHRPNPDFSRTSYFAGRDFHESPCRTAGHHGDAAWGHRTAGGKHLEIDSSLSQQHRLADHQTHPADPPHCDLDSLSFA